MQINELMHNFRIIIIQIFYLESTNNNKKLQLLINAMDV